MYEYGWEYDGIRTPAPAPKSAKVMTDYRGTELKEGDRVAIYWGYNQLEGGIIRQIKGKKAKVEVLGTLSKWKDGDCMVKLVD